MNGFSFDSEDEADKMPDAISHRTNENDGIKEPSASKQKRKAEKTSVCILDNCQFEYLGHVCYL